MLNRIKILLADVDGLRRDGLAAVLRGQPGYDIAGQCPDSESALEQIRALRPDVAVIDLDLSGLQAVELLRKARGDSPATKIVILSGTADAKVIREVVEAGADGYILKTGPSRHLIDAISYVRDGGQYLSPQLRRDRDFEILGMMADGIRPVLDRLDEIDGRVNRMEADSGTMPRFHQQLEAAHVQMLETFVKKLQATLVQRVSALETDLSTQSAEMQQLNGYAQLTDDTLARPKRIQAPVADRAPGNPVQETRSKRRRRKSRSFSPKAFWFATAALLLVTVAGTGMSRMVGRARPPVFAAQPAAKAEPPAAGTDTTTRMQAAQQYTERKDYAMAEDIYSQVIKSEPRNSDALKLLASVLYRDNKIEESAAILDKLPRN